MKRRVPLRRSAWVLTTVVAVTLATSASGVSSSMLASFPGPAPGAAAPAPRPSLGPADLLGLPMAHPPMPSLQDGGPFDIPAVVGLPGAAPDPVVAMATQLVGLPAQGDIPARALMAYQAAARSVQASDPACGLDWTLIAGIGRVESNHGRYGGARLGADGVSEPKIIGIALDGRPGVALITDTDRGVLDGDTTFDRAVGPLQFIPTTWALLGADGNGDGKADPHNIDDAALAAARYLCSGNSQVSDSAGALAALMRYNHSAAYGQRVLGLAQAYRGGVSVDQSVASSQDAPAVVSPRWMTPFQPAPPARAFVTASGSGALPGTAPVERWTVPPSMISEAATPAVTGPAVTGLAADSGAGPATEPAALPPAATPPPATAPPATAPPVTPPPATAPPATEPPATAPPAAAPPTTVTTVTAAPAPTAPAHTEPAAAPPPPPPPAPKAAPAPAPAPKAEPAPAQAPTPAQDPALCPAPAGTDATTATSTSIRCNPVTYAARLVRETNEARAAQGLPALAVTDCARAAAQGRADGSIGVAELASTPAGVAVACAPATGAAELLRRSVKTPSAVVQGWLAVAADRAALLDPAATGVGAGCALDGGKMLCALVLLRP